MMSEAPDTSQEHALEATQEGPTAPIAAKPVLTRGERNIRWIERYLHMPDGEDRKFKLVPFQRDIVLSIYDNPAVTRTAIISMPKKTAKTTLTACLLLLHLVGPEARPNAELYSAAQTQKQAAQVFKFARQIVERSPKIRDHIRVTENLKMLRVPRLGTRYMALTNDSRNEQGPQPSMMVFDELGQVKGPSDPMYDNCQASMVLIKDPLSIVISTQAARDEDLLSKLIDDAATGVDPKVVLKLYTCPKEIDPFSEEALRIANPAWDTFAGQDALKAEQAKAKRFPSSEGSFRNYTLNQRIETDDSPYINLDIWKENAGKPDDWHGKKVWLSLDLSETQDLTSLTLAFRDEAGLVHVHPWFWLPKEGIIEKEKKDRVEYQRYAKDGLLYLSEGRTVNYADVAAKIREIDEGASIQRIAYDAYNVKYLRVKMEGAGLDEDWMEEHLVGFSQRTTSFEPAIREMEDLIMAGKLRHGGHAILGWCVRNAKIVRDTSGNRKFDKKNAAKRIDGAVTLAMTIGIMTDPDMQPPESEPFIWA